MADPLRVLLVGSRILPFRHGGDKNYWLDVIHELRNTGHAVDVLSVALDEVEAISDFPIHWVRPIPVVFGGATRFNADHRFLTGTNNYASKTISLPRLFRAIRRRRREFRPDVIHFADNFGPGMAVARIACSGIPITISAPTYQRNRMLYDLALKTSFRPFDTIVPLSDAYAARLRELGFPADRLRTIRWGVDTNRFAPRTHEIVRMSRHSLGVRNDDFVILWTGFTQQSDRPELEFSIEAAARALEHVREGLRFLFCFKEEHFQPSFANLERPGLQVFHTPSAFLAASLAADVLFSPLLDARTTAAPPLVWAEALALGMPVLTTPVPGSEEAVPPGRAGAIVGTADEAAKWIVTMAGDPARRRALQESARAVAVERFSMRKSVEAYVALWRELVAARQ